MKTLNLANYTIDAKVKDEQGKLVTQSVGYNVRDSLIAVLFELPAKARDLLDRDDLARKIRDEASDVLTLSAAEADKLKAAFDAFSSFGKHDTELVRRVLD